MLKKNKKKIFLAIISLFFSIIFIFVSIEGYINVYLLKNSEITIATVITTKIHNYTNISSASKEVLYKFVVDNEEYNGSYPSVELKNYKTDEEIKIFYNKENPDKNGIMKVNTIALLFGISIIIMVLVSIKKIL